MYGYQNFYDWLACLFSCPGIEAALEESANVASIPYDPNAEATNIQHSRIWKEFLGPNRAEYTLKPEHLTFGIFMDGINSYRNKQAGKHASITFMIMTCYSLPLELQYKPQNLFVIGIAPGPKKPFLEQVNWILCPIVEQLKVLWSPGLVLSTISLFPQGCCVHASILPFLPICQPSAADLDFPPPQQRACAHFVS